MRFIRVLFAIVLVLSLSRGLISEDSMSNVYGKVVDAETKEPVMGVRVYINVLDEYHQDIYTITGDNGEFSFKRFPADDYQYVVTAEISSSRGRDLDLRYFNQSHSASFILPKGKNLSLKPIELQPGSRVNGQILLPDNKTVTQARIIFFLAAPLENEPRDYLWTSVSPITDGSFLSQLLPPDRDLIMEVNCLSSDGTGFVGVQKPFKLEKGSTAQSIDIAIPDSRTEIKGIVVDDSGIPLEDQVVGINGYCGTSITTDENGSFCIRSIPAGKTDVLIKYRGLNYHTHFIYNLPINSNESIFLRITSDEDNVFNYLISRSPLN